MTTNSVRVIRRAILACLLAGAGFLGFTSVSSLGFSPIDSLSAPVAATLGDPALARLQTAPNPLPQGNPVASGITPTLNSEGDAWVWPPSAPGPQGRTGVWPWSTGPVTWDLPLVWDQEMADAGLAAMLATEPAAVASYRAAQDRIQVALLAFDAARNAGPEAVISFDESATEEVRAIIAVEVAEARVALAGAPPSGVGVQLPAGPMSNRVGVDGACAYATIQAAINAAPNGATVRLVGGEIFTESIDFNARLLTIEGGYNATCAALVLGSTSRVDGVSDSTVDVMGGSVVSLRNLIITRGSGPFGGGLDLIGASQVTLSNTDVFSNAGANGGGIYIGSGSQVTLTNGSLVSNNTASSGGGAIVYGRLSALDTASDITGNTATGDGGGVYVSAGTLYLNGADVHDNAAAGAAGRGGAIYAVAGAVVTFTTSSFIGESSPCCNVAYDGAGIYANNSRIYSLGGNSTILQNHAAHNGGGLYLTNGSLFSAAVGTNIGYDVFASNGNTATLGAGIYVQTSTVEFAGRIINNVASNSGGGIYATASVVNLTAATVGGPWITQTNKIGPAGLNGAGLYLDGGTRATLSSTTVSSNTLQNSATGYGGGLYLRSGSAVTLVNSLVERHFAPSVADGRGAGIYAYDAQVTIDHSQLISNTAASKGGGIRLFGASLLTVTNGSTLSYNLANNGEGGAIAATNAPTIIIRDSTLQNNRANTDGGAIYLDAGSLDITGWWDVRSNHADGSGGAIAVRGTADAGLAVTGGAQPSYLAANKAAGNGGAILLGNATTLQLYATSGWPLSLNTNGATNGGAVYADAGGFLDVYGYFQATTNQAMGNGGVFYLAGGSRLWLDDYFTTRPQVLVNLAQNGGAIYASGSPRVECDGADFGYVNDGNTAASGSGGAIYLSGSTLLADNCVFRHNSAADNGGAIAAFTSTVTLDVDYPSPVALAVAGSGDRLSLAGIGPQATACQPASGQCGSLHNNTAGTVLTTTGSGGAIYTSDSLLSVNQTYLHRNVAARGGAIYQVGAASRSYISNTLVYSNTSTQAFGAGIRVAAGAITITHGTLANNVGGAGFSPGSVSSYLYDTIIWGNSTAAYGALTATSCNIDQGGTAGPASNPLFVSAGASEDYRVLYNSPAVDACVSGLTTDISNRVRPFGARYDMGAHEFPVHPVYLPVVTRQ